MYLLPSELQNIRTVYDLNNLLSNLGGVVGVLMNVFGVVFYPMAQFLYYINSAKRLFMARTRDPKIFAEANQYDFYSKFEKRMYDVADPKQIP